MKHSQGGFTLIEMIAAMALMAAVGTATVSLIRISQAGAKATVEMTTSWGGMRRASGMMADDMAQCSASRMVLATVSSEQQVTLQQPIGTTAGVADWGVCDPTQPVAARMRSGWFIRWTVRTVSGERQLVRQLLDATQTMKSEAIIARRLRPGTGTKPGFKVQANAQMWTITLSADGPGGAVETIAFDVGLRNS